MSVDKKHRLNCVICGKNFLPARIGYLCCSRQCGGKYKSSKNSITTKCSSCGKQTKVNNYRIKTHKNNYCSRKCADNGHSKNMLKKMGVISKGNRNYISGRSYEYKVVKYLKSKGFIAQRSPGSRGIFDVWGFIVNQDSIDLRFIQVKAFKGVTNDKALSKKDKSIMIDRVLKDNFKWTKTKLNGVPKWASTTTFELWVFNKKGKCNKFKLDFNNEVSFVPFEE